MAGLYAVLQLPGVLRMPQRCAVSRGLWSHRGLLPRPFEMQQQLLRS